MERFSTQLISAWRWQGRNTALDESETAEPDALAPWLQRSMLELTEAHLLDDGSRVDYETLRSSAEFARFCSAVGELGALPAAALADGADESERTAFWINVYNTLVIHGVVAVGAPEDGAERARFFSGESGVVYRVAGACFSLDDIEHGILRANAPPHGRRRAEPCFASGDARQLYSLRTCDARVHFALNCGARSCPPIRIYSAAHLDDELGLAARAFVESEVDVPSAADRPSRVRASRLLEWYASDFGATGSEGSRDGPSIEIVRSRVTCRVGGAETQSASVVSTRTSKSSCTEANSSSLSRLSPAGMHCSSSRGADVRSGFCS